MVVNHCFCALTTSNLIFAEHNSCDHEDKLRQDSSFEAVSPVFMSQGSDEQGEQHVSAQKIRAVRYRKAFGHNF